MGHTSTILIVGLIFILGKLALNENIFKYLEAGVGMMLIGLGLYRIVYIKKSAKTTHKHLPNGQIIEHKLAYGVGLIHGLAGSGALILSVLTTIEGSLSALFYLAIFGLGSILGMALAAGIFSMPFSVKIMKNKNVKFSLILLSAVLCIFLGTWIVFRNLTI